MYTIMTLLCAGTGGGRTNGRMDGGVGVEWTDGVNRMNGRVGVEWTDGVNRMNGRVGAPNLIDDRMDGGVGVE